MTSRVSAAAGPRTSYARHRRGCETYDVPGRVRQRGPMIFSPPGPVGAELNSSS